MIIALNGSRIEVIVNSDGEEIAEDILPMDALRYAKTLKALAEQLIEEFPGPDEEK